MRRCGNIAIIQSLSHVAHYRYASGKVFSEAANQVPWIKPIFYTEQSFHDLMLKLKRKEIDGIVFSSGCLQSLPLRQLLSEDDACSVLNEAFNDGVGFALLHQLLPLNLTFEIKFFPKDYGISIAGGQCFELKKGIASDGISLNINEEKTDLHDLVLDQNSNFIKVWLTYQFKFASDWKTRIWIENDKSKRVLCTHRSASHVITSSIALDWYNKKDALASILARVVRERGVLYHIRNNSVIDSVSFGHLEAKYAENSFFFSSDELQKYSLFFVNEFFSPEIPLEKIAFSEKNRIRKQLERGGVISGYIDGMHWGGASDLPALVELSGPLPYTQLATWYSKWILSYRTTVSNWMTFDIRSLSKVCTSIYKTFVDESSIPPGLLFSDVKELVIAATKSRLKNGECIDDLIIPTTACCASLLELGCDKEAAPLIEWIQRALDSCKCKSTTCLDDDYIGALSKVLLWIPQMRTPERLIDILKNGQHSRIDAYTYLIIKGYFESSLKGKIEIDTLNELTKIAMDKDIPIYQTAEIALFLVEKEYEFNISDIANISSKLSKALHSIESSFANIESVSLAVASLIQLESMLPIRIANNSSSCKWKDLILNPVPFERELLASQSMVKKLEESQAATDKKVIFYRNCSIFWLTFFIVTYVLLILTCIFLFFKFGTELSFLFKVGIASLAIVPTLIATAKFFNKFPHVEISR